jgi:hypothetical protein
MALPRARCSRHRPNSSRHSLCREGTLGRALSALLGRQRPLCREPRQTLSLHVCREGNIALGRRNFHKTKIAIPRQRAHRPAALAPSPPLTTPPEPPPPPPPPHATTAAAARHHRHPTPPPPPHTTTTATTRHHDPPVGPPSDPEPKAARHTTSPSAVGARDRGRRSARRCPTSSLPRVLYRRSCTREEGVRHADTGSAATAPRPTATPRHEVRGERRGEEGVVWLCRRRRELREG